MLTVENWYVACLTEREARKLIQHIPGTMCNGSVRSFHLLPEEAQCILRDEFVRVCLKSNLGDVLPC